MTFPWHWADRGKKIRIESAGQLARPVTCLIASRHGSLEFAANQICLWVQMRGESWVDASEGRFQLQAGHWLILERDSHPITHAGSNGLCLGLAIAHQDLQVALPAAQTRLYPGQGNGLSHTELQVYLRLWRRLQRTRMSDNAWVELHPLLNYMTSLQAPLQDSIRRCPGRSHGHRHQVFSRLQRTRLYMQGHRNRMVRMTELADLANFSSYYFSRTYTQVYEERPQATATRLRLEHAGELLASTMLPIGEIAAASGFENCCSFARAFRAHFGISATDYRRGNQAA